MYMEGVNEQRSLPPSKPTTDVPLSKAPNCSPGAAANGCPLLRVCVHGVYVFTAECSLLCMCTWLHVTSHSLSGHAVTYQSSIGHIQIQNCRNAKLLCMSLHFRSPAFACIWMEVDGTKSVVWLHLKCFWGKLAWWSHFGRIIGDILYHQDFPLSMIFF